MPVFGTVRSSRGFVTAVVTVAAFTDTLLYSLIIPLLPAILVSRVKIPAGEVQKWISILLSSFGGAQLLSPFIVGPYTDACKNKQTPFTLGLVLLGGASAMFFLGTNVWVLGVARSLQGFSSVIVWTSGITFMSTRLGPKHTPPAMGIVIAGWAMGDLCGPGVGGLFYEWMGEAGVMAVTGAVILFDIALRLLLLDPPEMANIESDDAETDALLPSSSISISNEEQGLLNQASTSGQGHPVVAPSIIWEERNSSHDLPDLEKPKRSVYATALTNFNFLASIFAIWIATACRAALETTVPLFVQQHFGWSAGIGGLVLLIMVIPGLLGPFLGRFNNHYGPRWSTSISFFCCGLLFLALGFVQQGGILTRIVFCCLIFGIGLLFMQITVAHMAGVSLVADELGKKGGEEGSLQSSPSGVVYAMMNQSFALGILLGPLWAGLVKDVFGWLVMCSTFTVGCVFSAIVVAMHWRGWVPV